MRKLGLCPILYYRSVMTAARVLVVDDDPAIRKIIADRMRAQGHEVEVAVDGEAALAAVADFDPELVLLDMKMPKMDGFEVLEALRRSESPPQVVMITAHGNIERAVRAIQLGAADFIAKPFEAAQLDHTRVARARSGWPSPAFATARDAALRPSHARAWRLEGHERGAWARGSRSRQQCHGAASRRKRERQGGDGPAHPSAKPARKRAVHRPQLRDAVW